MMYKNLNKSLITLFFYLLITSCFTINLQAQSMDSLTRVYNNETIHSYDQSFIKGSNQLKFGDLKKEFKSDITRDLYKKAKGQRILGGVVTVTAISAIIAGAILKKNDKNGSLPLTLSGVGLNIWGFHLRKHSTQLVDRAIWQRNKEVLFGATP